MSLETNLKVAVALMVTVLATLLLPLVSFLQTLLQTVFLGLALVGSNVLTMVLFPLQILFFPAWVVFYLILDTAALIYIFYLWWWSSKFPDSFLIVHERDGELVNIRK